MDGALDGGQAAAAAAAAMIAFGAAARGAGGATRRDPRVSSIPALANAPEALRPADALRSKLGHLAAAPRISQVMGFTSSDQGRRAAAETASAAAKIRSEKLSIEAPAALGAAAMRTRAAAAAASGGGVGGGKVREGGGGGGGGRGGGGDGGGVGVANDALVAALAYRREAAAEAAARRRHAAALYRRRRTRRHSIFEDADRARPRLYAAHPDMSANVEELDEQYRLRVAAAAAAASAKAKRSWGAARAKLNVGAAAKGLILRDTLLHTISEANRQKERRDEAEFKWMHDVELFRLIPFKARCQLARACHRKQCSRGQVVCEQSDDADTALIVAAGRVQLSVTRSDGLSRHDRTWTDIVGEISAGATLEAEGGTTGNSGDSAQQQRVGAMACAGLECLLTGAPRHATMTVKSPDTVIMEVPRDVLAEILDEDDDRRVRERAAALDEAAAKARRVAKDEKMRITEEELEAAAERAVAAHKADLAEHPPPLSVREQIFRCETRRQLEDCPGYGVVEEAERRTLFESLFRRIKISAHTVGLAPLEFLSEDDTQGGGGDDDAGARRGKRGGGGGKSETAKVRSDGSEGAAGGADGGAGGAGAGAGAGGGGGGGERRPRRRSRLSNDSQTGSDLGEGENSAAADWGANRRALPQLVGTGPDGNSNLDDAGVQTLAKLRRVPLLSELTRAELRHVVARGVPERTVDQGGKTLITELDDSTSSMFIVVEGVGEVLKSKQPTKLDPNPAPARVAKVKVGDVVGEICLLTGGKRSATVAASMSRKAPPKMHALEVPKQALRAVVERRPTLIDGFARSIARRWVADQVNAVGMELRLAYRITESAVSHFKGGRAMWAKAGGTIRAAVHKTGLAARLMGGGAGALFAAAAGAAGKKTAMTDAECAAVLSRAPLLRSLHASEIHAIVAHGVRRVRCPAGELHIAQGNPGGSMYLVLSGRFDVLVKVSAGSGGLETVGHFNVGEAFGEMSLLTGARRTASVRASEDSWVLEVSRRGVESAVRGRPLLVDDFAKFIADRQRENQALERTFSEDESELSLWNAEQHQQLVEAIQAWILRGEQTEAAQDDDRDEGVMRVNRRRIAFGEVSRNVLELLLKVDVFCALDRTQLLVMLREGAFLENHPPGSRVVKQGEEGKSMYVVLEGELDVDLEKIADGSRGGGGGKSKRVALRRLTRGDIFGELCLLTGAPRSASVTASYQGATLVELGRDAIVPILLNVKAFVPTAAAVVAGRYLDRDPAWAALGGAAREERLALRAERLAESVRNFHDVPADGETDARGAARKLMGRVGLAVAADDPSSFNEDNAAVITLNLGGGGGGGGGGVRRDPRLRPGADNTSDGSAGVGVVQAELVLTHGF